MGIFNAVLMVKFMGGLELCWFVKRRNKNLGWCVVVVVVVVVVVDSLSYPQCQWVQSAITCPRGHLSARTRTRRGLGFPSRF